MKLDRLSQGQFGFGPDKRSAAADIGYRSFVLGAFSNEYNLFVVKLPKVRAGFAFISGGIIIDVLLDQSVLVDGFYQGVIGFGKPCSIAVAIVGII